MPAELAALLNSRTIPNATTSPWQYEGGVDWLPAYSTETNNNVYQLITGLRGDLPFTKDWTWEIYGSHGKTAQNAHLPESFLSLPRVRQLFQADHYGLNWQNPQTIAVTGKCTSGLADLQSGRQRE